MKFLGFVLLWILLRVWLIRWLCDFVVSSQCLILRLFNTIFIDKNGFEGVICSVYHCFAYFYYEFPQSIMSVLFSKTCQCLNTQMLHWSEGLSLFTALFKTNSCTNRTRTYWIWNKTASTSYVCRLQSFWQQRKSFPVIQQSLVPSHTMAPSTPRNECG